MSGWKRFLLWTWAVFTVVVVVALVLLLVLLLYIRANPIRLDLV